MRVRVEISSNLERSGRTQRIIETTSVSLDFIIIIIMPVIKYIAQLLAAFLLTAMDNRVFS